MIIGRKHEQEIFSQFLRSSEPQFMALYGRRRAGKTFLVSEYFKNQGLYFEITGIKNAALSEQLGLFSQAVHQLYRPPVPLKTPESWLEAFDILKQLTGPFLSDKKAILFF